MTIFAKKGPAYVNGDHVITFARDVNLFDAVCVEDVEWVCEGAIAPGEILPRIIEGVFSGKLEFTQ
jgi:hypothetical protein